MSVNLGNLAIVAGTNTQFQGCPQSGAKAILIGNESGLNCTITMEGGNVQKTLYPSTVDWFQIKPGFSGTIKIAPTALLSNTSSWPASSLVFDAVGLDDPENASMYPLPLVRNTNVGNTVSTTGGSTTSVTNDNQPLTPQNQFIEATPTGASGSTVVIATDGTMTIKGDVASVLTTLLQLIPGAAAGASSVKLSDSSRQTEILGTLLIDGNGHELGTFAVDGTLTATDQKNSLLRDTSATVQITIAHTSPQVTVANDETISGVLTVTGASTLTGAVTATNNSNNIQASTLQGGANLPAGRLGFATDGDILDANSATGTYIKARTAGTIFFQTPNGTEIGHFDSAGLTLTASHDTIDISATSGNLKMQAGTLTRMTSFSGTGSVTVNTGLGTTPTQITFNPCNISGSSQTIGGTNAQSTVVTTGSGLGWGGVAYKS